MPWLSLSRTTSAKARAPGPTRPAGARAWLAMKPMKSPRLAMPVQWAGLSTTLAKAHA